MVTHKGGLLFHFDLNHPERDSESSFMQPVVNEHALGG